MLLSLSAQAQTKYWIQFTDKGETHRYRPEELLSPSALERRMSQEIPIDEYDYPVSPAYLDSVCQLGIQPLQKSRWLNRISAVLDPEQAAKISRLPFVAGVNQVKQYSFMLTAAEACEDLPDYNTYRQQLSMVGIDWLHAQGYTGKGVTVAVFDNGYLSTPDLLGFAHLFEEGRILATRDYVDGDEDVYGPCSHCKHGTWVFSIMAAQVADGLTGTAPDATYILLRTENDASETHQEEDNWVAAAEFADSLGAQVFNTSLGYFDFDPGEGDYTREDLDGNTSVITMASDIAASRGIVVVNSAGNSGSLGLSMPADGDSVIAVGAVDPCEAYAGFSSQGPSADGRVKPDVAALGASTYFLDISGDIRRGNGTSFSSPIIAGLMANLIQAYPQATLGDLYQALIQSASQFATPDSLVGYGLPDGAKAWEILRTSVGEGVRTLPGIQTSLAIFPQPHRGECFLQFSGTVPAGQARISVLNLAGQTVFQQTLRLDQGHVYPLSFSLPSGLYLLQVDGHGGNAWRWTGKMVVQ